MNSDQIVRTEVTETLFGFYTDREKKEQLSVCNVTSPLTLDTDSQAILNGLYDGHMGPLNQGNTCLTCGLGYVVCPGHPGHIELDVPVYYPLMFPALFQLLRSKCIFCHKLRLSKFRVRYYLVKLKLIEMGEITTASTLLDMLQPSVIFSDEEEVDDLTSQKKCDKKTAGDLAEGEAKLQFFEERYDIFVAGSTNKAKQPLDLYAKALQRETIDSFQRAALLVKKCENCGAFSPPIRKDGYSKIFQKPMPKRLHKNMNALKLKVRTALEALTEKANGEESISGADSDDVGTSGDETDSVDSQVDGHLDSAVNEGDKYMVPLEVEGQIRLLWQQNGDILDYIWKRCIRNDVIHSTSSTKQCADEEEGWRLFFTRVILVPPNKYRPAAKVGDTTSEHPQNIHLIRILEHNSKIRLLQSNVDISKMNGYGVKPSSSLGSLISGAVSEDAQLSTSAHQTVLNKMTVNEGSMELSKLVTVWIDLQNAVNCYIDSAKDPNPLGSNGAPSGIRQLLERKEGLFRRHMMGKRVNYCCRSVISPDNYIGTNEIGIPVHFAMALHYPTPVNDWNVKYLRTLVERGPLEYPGANQIETADGRIIKLEKLSAMERAGKAKLLLATPGNKVYRHLIDGDVLLVNRQPTLQKPGIMAHKARVLRHVKEQTLRMHYANCNTYNADFDGDEMNCHFVQSELARAEATYICNNDNQYVGPTSGSPLRGLIQDHVAGGVKLTCKDTFLTRSEFQQLLFIAVTGLPGTEVVSPMEDMVMPLATVFKPVKLWTGKQVISSLLSHMCRAPLPSLHLDGKARTPATAFGAEHLEHEVVIRHGELLCGVMDKNSVGSVSLGVVHAVYELYGAELAGRLLNAFGRLFTYVLQDFGLTCGIHDLVLTKDADEERCSLLKKVAVDSERGLLTFLNASSGEESALLSEDNSKPLSREQRLEAENSIASFLESDRINAKVKLDGAMQSIINKSASDVIKACLPNGLQATFLTNNFSTMVLTGAKGSAVNQSQISCFLGQQALEGQRVPLMVSGKSLPSFKANDCSARAGGFVQDRFLTGVKPQEYYFHCMAGREGLVDTAVKTSRSGYLQRCLVKHLEELKIHYDNTVRDSGGNVVQFLYGEDGLDPIQASLLGGKANQMLFLARNNQALVHKFSLHQDFFNQGLEMASAQKHHCQVAEANKLAIAEDKMGCDLSIHLKVGSIIQARRKVTDETNWCRGNMLKNWVCAEVVKCRMSESGNNTYDLRYTDGVVVKKVPIKITVRPKVSAGGGPMNVQAGKLPIYLIKKGLPDTAMNSLRLDSSIGAVSEKIQDAIAEYCKKNPDNVVTNSGSETTVTAEALELLVWVKYMRSLACPGEAVGCVAAQSVGEPSTQMTLNTFHLAGHGGANVTLGIPRLREIIMTASKSLKTPTMLVSLAKKKDMHTAKALARKLSRLTLSSLLCHRGGVEVGEFITRNSISCRWERKYRIRLQFEKLKCIETAFGVTFEHVIDSVKTKFLTRLDSFIKLEQRRAGERVTSKNDPLKQFRSDGGDEHVTHQKGGKFDDGENNESYNGDEVELSEDHIIQKSGTAAKVLDSDEEEDEDEGDDNVDQDLGNLRLGGSGKELMGYDDDDDEGEDLDDSKKKKVKQELQSLRDEVIHSDKDSEEDEVNLSTLVSSKNKKVGFSSDMRKRPRRGVDRYENDSVTTNAEFGFVEIQISFPAQARRLLMAQIAEKATLHTMVRSTKDIQNAYPIQGTGLESNDRVGVQVEGVNFEAIWALPENLVDMNTIRSNDINRILLTYGVEAARQCIVSEIIGVFGVYGIDVNARHLSLIADFMTRNGNYAAMNRIGMNDCPSPFLQMSFETTCSFLTKAAQEGQSDMQESPSSRIVLGSVTKVGTGCFELMLPLNAN